MNSDKRKDYYVGLDMGTGSLGGGLLQIHSIIC